MFKIEENQLLSWDRPLQLDNSTIKKSWLFKKKLLIGLISCSSISSIKNIFPSFPGCLKAYTRPTHLKRHVANSHVAKRQPEADDDSSDDEAGGSSGTAKIKREEPSFECSSCPKKVDKPSSFPNFLIYWG